MSHRLKIVLWLGLGVLVCIVAGAVFVVPNYQTGGQGGNETTIVFLGDTYFGESYKPYDLLDDGGYRERLDPFREFLHDADAVVLNLETTLTPEISYPRTEDKAYRHYGDATSTLNALVDAGVTAVSLANNHTMDYGPEGFARTLDALEQYGVNVVGGGVNLEEAQTPHVITLEDGTRVAVFGLYEENQLYRDKYVFYASPESSGVAPFDIASFRTQVAVLRATVPDAFVVAFPHWGKNYAMTSEWQKRAGEALIDAGADLVVGHGAHQMQEVWQYEGKWIVSSIGNFVFLSPGRYATKGSPPYSALSRLLFRDHGITLRVYPIVTDNKRTDFQPRMVSDEEFQDATQGVPGKRGKDVYGTYIELVVR